MINSLGPSHYEPKDEIARKVVKTPIWSNSQTRREPTKNPTLENPGPGYYNQSQNSISIKQIKNLLASESAKHPPPEQGKVQNKLDQIQKSEHQAKLKSHVDQKHEVIQKRGPGMYNVFSGK